MTAIGIDNLKKGDSYLKFPHCFSHHPPTILKRKIFVQHQRKKKVSFLHKGGGAFVLGQDTKKSQKLLNLSETKKFFPNLMCSTAVNMDKKVLKVELGGRII